MGHKKKPPAEFESLKPYATANELACLNALIKFGNRADAAKAIGKNINTFSDAIATVRKRAASRGWAPDHDWRKPVPEGHRIKGNSTLFEAGAVPGELEVGQQWVKSERDTDDEAHPPQPPEHLIERTAYYYDAQGKVRGRWVSTKRNEVDRWDSMVKAARDVCSELSGFCGVAPLPIERTESDTISVYGFGDPHAGQHSWGGEVGEDFDLKIVTETTTAVVRRLVDSAANSDVGLLALIGDNFHADDDRQVTPGHGHKLDVDTRAPKVFRAGCILWKTAIDHMLLKHRRVRVVVIRGNHDPLTSFFLAEWLRAIYALDSRVEILDNVREHQYVMFGGVLLGFTHGDKAKPEAMAGVMSADEPDLWAQATAERHWITGHIHSKTWWDFRGCSLETLRTNAPEDAYASRHAYRSRRGSVVITYHKDFGEIGRNTVTPARAGVIIPSRAQRLEATVIG